MKKKPKKALMKATHKSLKFYGDVLCSLPEDRTRPILTSIPPEQFVLGPSSSLYSGVFFGVTCDDSGKKIVGKRMNDDAHILIAGGSGQGKTQGIVIPTMATWTGSQIVLDIKGELLDFHSQLSKKRVIVFSPENLDGKSYHYDPFAPLRHDSKDAIAGHAWALARTLIPKSSHLQDPIWIDTAQSFLTAALIYYYDLGVMFVDAINAIVTTGIQEIIQQIMNGSCELAKVRIHQIAKVSENVLSSIGMELNLLSPLITDSSMRNAITVSSNEKVLNWYDLNEKNEPVDIILSLPEEKLSHWEPLLRLMLNQLINTLEARPARTYGKYELPPLLIMLDEFPRLGKIPDIQQGLSTLRSRGVTFALCIQSLAQLDKIYGENVRKIICDNCALKVLLAASDVETQQYYSALVGMGPALDVNFSLQYRDSVCGDPIGTSLSISPTRKPYIYPEEFSRLNSLVVVSPMGPFFLRKVFYAKNPDLFSPLFAPLSTSKVLQKAVPEMEALLTSSRKEYIEFMKESQDRIAQAVRQRSMAEKRAKEQVRKRTEAIYFQLGKMVCHYFPALLDRPAHEHSAESTSALKKFENMLSLIAELSTGDESKDFL